MKSISVYFLILASYVLIQFLKLESTLVYLDLPTHESKQISEIIKNTVIIILAIVWIKKLGLVRLSGISSNSSWKQWYLLLIPLYLVFIGVMQVRYLNFSDLAITQLILLFFSTLSIGFSEELVFRGLLQSFLLKVFLKERGKRMIFSSVFFTSIIFGLLHLINFNVENAVPEAAQFFYSTFIDG